MRNILSDGQQCVMTKAGVLRQTLINPVSINNKKDRWDSGKPRRQQIPPYHF